MMILLEDLKENMLSEDGFLSLLLILQEYVHSLIPLLHKKAFVSINPNSLWLYCIQSSLMHEKFTYVYLFISCQGNWRNCFFSFWITITFLQEANFNNIDAWNETLGLKYFRYFYGADSDIGLKVSARPHCQHWCTFNISLSSPHVQSVNLTVGSVIRNVILASLKKKTAE